jgi:hypothetical protein
LVVDEAPEHVIGDVDGGKGECVDADVVLGDLDRSGLCQRIDATLSRRVSITSRTAASSLTSA